MKNKKSIYVLLPLVLLIWGAIIYQFFSYSNTELATIPTQDFSAKPLKIKMRDTFIIKINPRDPFSGEMINDEMATKSTKKKSIKQQKVIEEIVWPQIQYKGVVSDNKDKVKVYMVIINGKTHLMKKGQEEEEVFLKEGDKETIYVLYQKYFKIVYLQ